MPRTFVTAVLSLFLAVLLGGASASALIRPDEALSLSSRQTVVHRTLRSETFSPIYQTEEKSSHLIENERFEAKMHRGTEGPFGEYLGQTGSRANSCPFRYSTRRYDPETGFYCFGKRYYDPVSKVWLSRDPAREGGGTNLYAYCNDDPVGNVDPFGLATEAELLSDAEIQEQIIQDNYISPTQYLNFTDYFNHLERYGRFNRAQAALAEDISRIDRIDSYVNDYNGYSARVGGFQIDDALRATIDDDSGQGAGSNEFTALLQFNIGADASETAESSAAGGLIAKTVGKAIGLAAPHVIRAVPRIVHTANQLKAVLSRFGFSGAGGRPGKLFLLYPGKRGAILNLLPRPSNLPQRILFGQRRISGTFSSQGDAPDYILGRSIYDVAADIESGKISPYQILIKYTYVNGQFITLNNRALATLSLAGKVPSNIEFVRYPTIDELSRLDDIPLKGFSIPGSSIPITIGPRTLTILDTVHLP